MREGEVVVSLMCNLRNSLAERMNKQAIIEAADRIRSTFTSTLEGETYQLRGILNTEALLIAALAEAYGVSLIVESGRARGYSTYLLAKYFQAQRPALRIVSIDLDDTSADAAYSEQKLAPFVNVTLRYGDAKQLIAQQVTEPCLVFIDGPKGDAAIKLAAELLQDERVKAVLVHDLHQDVFTRDIAELVFTETFFSDDEDFVRAFQDLDANCWEVMANTGYKPYVRAGESTKSYGHTLAVFFNNERPVRTDVYERYRAYLSRKRKSLKTQLMDKLRSTIWGHYRTVARRLAGK